MLVIKRVPTMVSLNQDENIKCGRDCLGSCCVAGSRLPMYRFFRHYFRNPQDFGYLNPFYVPDVDSYDQITTESSIDTERSELDTLITSQWDDRTNRGLFRYDVTVCETKILPGPFGFIAQLNEGRHSKKRSTEFRVDQVLQDFDDKKFNFTKVGQEEALFCFEESEESRSSFQPSVPITQSPNIVAINVSPIEYGHILLVPRVLDCIPQRICESTLLLAIQMAMEVNNPYFRLGYNSLGAFATINHLHFQAYYLKYVLPIEKAPMVCVLKKDRKSGLRISSLRHYPVKTMVYDVGQSVDELAAVVAAACRNLQNENTPFNLLISNCGSRIFLIPQCYAEKQAEGKVPAELLDMQVNPAVWEISGHMVLKRKQDFEVATEEAAWDLLAEVSLPQSKFEKVKHMCIHEAELFLEKSNEMSYPSDLPFENSQEVFSMVPEFDTALLKKLASSCCNILEEEKTVKKKPFLSNQLVPQL